MYNFLLNQRKAGNLDAAKIDYSVTKGWLTTEQAAYLKTVSLELYPEEQQTV